MTWEFEFRGGHEVPNHSVPGTKSYAVDGRVDDTKNPPKELASVTGLEVTVNRNGIFVDMEDIHRQVSEEVLRRRFIIQVKRAMAEEDLTIPDRVPRTFRHQLQAEFGLRWQGVTTEDKAFRDRARKQIENLARGEGYTADDTILCLGSGRWRAGLLAAAMIACSSLHSVLPNGSSNSMHGRVAHRPSPADPNLLGTLPGSRR